MDTKVVEEAAVDGQGDGDRAAAGDLVLDGVDVVGVYRVPAGGCEVTRFSEDCVIGLRPTVGCLTIMGKDVELRVPLPLEKVKRGVIGQSLVLTAVELVPDEATGEPRALITMSFPVGHLLDSGEGLTDT